MSNFKENWKFFWKNVWEAIKGAILPLIMYFAASSCVFMVTLQEDMCGKLAEGLNGARIAWIVGAALVALVYHGFISYANGGTGYEMLVSGNMKRMTSGNMKISSHKEEKEYRPWRGVAASALISLFVVAAGILMGANQSIIDPAMANAKDDIDMSTGMVVLVFIIFLLSGWTVMPFFFTNMVATINGTATISYYWSCLFALLPLIVGGVFYVIGAYGKRAKAIKAQELADKASKEQVEKPKKINYGGLPGTKPKKRK